MMIDKYKKTHLIIGDPLFVAENIEDEATIIAPSISRDIAATWEAYSARIGLGKAADEDFRHMSAGERVASCLLFAISVARLRQLDRLRFLFDDTLQMISIERLEAIRTLAKAERVDCEWWKAGEGKIVEVAG